jgi:hypothetical protein
VRPGTAIVTVGNPQYGNAVSIVSVTAELDILGGNVSFPSPFTANLTIQFESQGIAIAAPGGGLPVVLTSRDAACVAAPAGVTISAGQTTRDATVSYGGGAPTPCQAYVVASATDVVSDSVLVSVTPPATITLGARTVGAGLQENSSGALNAAGHGGVTLTLTSSDPTAVLVSPGPSTPGTPSIDIPMAAGTNGFNFYVQGVEGATPGSAAVTATATGFNQGAATMTLVQPAVALSGPAASMTTLSLDDAFYAFVGTPSGSSVNAQNVRAGGPDVSVTFTLRAPAVGQLTDGATPGTTVTATIVPGVYYTPTSVAAGGVAYDPIGVGTDTISASATGYVSTPTATRGVTVTAPTITVGARTVGAGLQENSSGALNATGHGRVTLTLTSSDPSTVLVSPNASTPGTVSIDIPMGVGTSGFSFYVQGVEGASPGTGTVTATAPGFNQGAATMTLVQPAIALSGPAASMTTLSPDDAFYAFVGTPSGNSVSAQNVRAGGSNVSVTFNLRTPAVGQLTDGVNPGNTVTATIVPGLYYTPTSVAAGGVAYDPIVAGTDTISASATGYINTPAATRGVMVAAPTITLGARTVGAGLQENSSGALNATGHGGVIVTLTSSDPSTVLVSPNQTTAGTPSINIPMGAGTNGFTFYIQGVEGAASGTATVTATATGFNQGAATMTLLQPAIALSGPAATTTTLSIDDAFYGFVGIPSGSSVNAQNVRAGGPDVVVTFTTDNAGVGLLKTSSTSASVVTATIVPGVYYTPTSVAAGGVAHDPLGVGVATITARAEGFTPSAAATGTVTVSAPTITLGARTVGAGLQENSSGALNATGHPGVTLTLTSSDPSTVLVSPNATTPGAASIDIPMGVGTNGFSFYVQGIEGATGTATITATANGFLNGTASMTTVQPAIALSGVPTSTTAGAANAAFYAFVGTRSGSTVNAQNVRAGSPGVTVTATSSNTAAGTLVTQTQSGGSVTAVIVPGLYYTPTTFATGGFAFDPVAQGQTTVSTSASGFLTQPAGTVVVTVNP